MDKWYYAQRGGSRQGPVTLRELREMIEDEELLPEDMVWREGSPGWTPVSRAPELQEAPAPPQRREREDAAPARSPGGFLSALHRLPKPVLFGLYGALGGLLGALVLGELFWFLIRPAAAQKEPLRIATAPKVTAYLGGENRLTVKIARDGFHGPVALRVVDVPKDVLVEVPTIADEAEEGEIRLRTLDHALPGSHQLHIQAVSARAETISASTVVRLEVSPPPPTLFLAASSSVKIYAGDRNRCMVRITRQRFSGPVQVEAATPPEGITIEPLLLSENADEGQLEILLGSSARVGEHSVELIGRSLDRPEAQTKTHLNVIVEAVPPSLKVASSQTVLVYPGQSNRIGVKIARHHFTGPVSVSADALGVQATIAPITIPADQTEGELVVRASDEALPGGFANSVNVGLRATSGKLEATTRFVLRIEPAPPTLQVAVSPEVPVYAGESARFAVKIARDRFTGPVRVSLAGSPRFVSIPFTIIPADRSEADVTVTVDKAMLATPLPSKVPLTLELQSMTVTTARAEATTQLEVVAPPSDLRLTVSSDVEVYQGGRCRFTLKVARAGFLGPVQFAFKDVPAGVTLPEGEFPPDRDVIEWEGEATFDARVMKSPVFVVGTGTAASDGKVPTATAQMSLDVRKGDPKKKPQPLDIVFVLDISGSMTPQINGVRDGIVRFAAELKSRRLEHRIGMVVFRGGRSMIGKIPPGIPPGKLPLFKDMPDFLQVLNFKGKVFTTDFDAFRAEVGLLRAGGGGGVGENSYEAVAAASQAPFLADSMRILILITDEPPLPRGIPIQMAANAMDRGRVSQMHLVTRRKDFANYVGLQQKAKGAFFDITEASRGKGGFADLLPVLSKEIVRISVAGGAEAPVGKAPPALPPTKEAPKLAQAQPPKAPPTASAPTPPRGDAPVSPPADAVSNPRVPPVPPAPPVATVAVPPRAETPTLSSVQSDQAFDEKDRVQLILAMAIWTAVIAAIIGLALVCGQTLYLQKRFPSLGAVGKVLGAGVLAGLLGGALGQVFFLATSGGATWNLITRSAAWTLLGGLLGTGIGLFVPNLKWHRGLLGGCLGGFIGALGFTLFSLLGELLGRWIGAALLGFCLGLMIALAELAFRRYWLQITFGTREVRTVTLGATPIILGSDERLASVFISGAPPQALSYHLDGERVVCADLTTGRRSVIGAGEERTLGTVRIAVCSPATSASAGIQLHLASGKTLELSDGLPLTTEDLPGLQPQGSDGMVAIVSRRPAQPNVLLLRNRSKQTWRVVDAQGRVREIGPGLGLDLSASCKIDLGPVKATLVVRDTGDGIG